jgi:extracellular matrix protein 14
MVTSNPCSEAYPGSAAFEAVETKLIADFIKELQETRDVRAFIDVHSYGQLCKRFTPAKCFIRQSLTSQSSIVMFPYSYSCRDFPGDAETLMEAGLGVARALRNVHGTVYQSGQACDLV